MRGGIVHSVMVAIILSLSYQCQAQSTLSESPSWYGKVLRTWFPDQIMIHGSQYFNTRIRCSDSDITHFTATAGKTFTGVGPAFRIEGELKLDALPHNLFVVDGAQGEKYMLHLQAYLISPSGELLWHQQGYPVGNSWVDGAGSTTTFNLIGSFNKSLDGCICGILAVGDPIFIEGTSETRVILGMKRFSFKNDSESTTYDPSLVKPIERRKTRIEGGSLGSANVKKHTDLRYVQSEYNGWKYERLTSLTEPEKRKIFYELVKYQDKTGDDWGAYTVVGERYGLPERATKAIATEGGVKNWPMP